MHHEYIPTNGPQFVVMLFIYFAITLGAIMYVGANKLFFTKTPDENIKEDSQEAKF